MALKNILKLVSSGFIFIAWVLSMQNKPDDLQTIPSLIPISLLAIALVLAVLVNFKADR